MNFFVFLAQSVARNGSVTFGNLFFSLHPTSIPIYLMNQFCCAVTQRNPQVYMGILSKASAFSSACFGGRVSP